MNRWADRWTNRKNDIQRWVAYLKNVQFRNICTGVTIDIAEKTLNLKMAKKCKSVFSITFTFKSQITNTKRKQFQKNSILFKPKYDFKKKV